MTYYDGYGYNFYNGAYGYYEYSRPPVNNSGPPWKVEAFLTFLGVFVGALLLFIFAYYKALTWQGPEEEEVAAKKERSGFKDKMSEGISLDKNNENDGGGKQEKGDSRGSNE